MRSLVTDGLLGLAVTVPVLALLAVHELLSAIEGDSKRFAVARRNLSIVIWVLVVVVAIVVAARFYYLRAHH
jgi:hypothetical protein